jgi:PIN domain nuclease of toxin-antitoxin system
MRRLLLDTNVLLWWLAGNRNLKQSVTRIIAAPESEVFVSAATTWEISIKRKLGKIRAPENMEAEILKEGFSPLPITLFHGQLAGSLPDVHRDPFDRMLIAQAQAEGLEVVSGDRIFAQYEVKLVPVWRGD